jgi:hypothetical protein
MTESAYLTSGDLWLNLQPGQPANQSPASERLIRALAAHLSAEAQDLADCEALVKRSCEPDTRVLLGLIIADQEHHRALLESMVQRLGGGIDPSPAPAVRSMGDLAPLGEVELAAALRVLIRNDHEAARHLRHIARQESSVFDGLYSMLLETIARDSEKHAAISHFLLTRLERRAP